MVVSLSNPSLKMARTLSELLRKRRAHHGETHIHALFKPAEEWFNDKEMRCFEISP